MCAVPRAQTISENSQNKQIIRLFRRQHRKNEREKIARNNFTGVKKVHLLLLRTSNKKTTTTDSTAQSYRTKTIWHNIIENPTTMSR